MWVPSLGSFSSKRSSLLELDTSLKTLQDRIMENVEVFGTKKNQMVLGGEINEWHFHNPAPTTKIQTPTILIHGYAASSMAFHRTFGSLSRDIRDLYAIDLPGNGLSLPVPMPADTPKARVTSFKVSKEKGSNTIKARVSKLVDRDREKEILQLYEDYYLERIDEWRQLNGIEKLNIVGHSFGGYISFKYAIKYPDRVKDLCLISPLGMERNIYSLNNTLEEGREYILDEENPTLTTYTRNFKIPEVLYNNQLNVLRWMGPVGGRLARRYIDFAYRRVPGTGYGDYLYRIFYESKTFPKVTISNFNNMFTRSLLAKDPIMDNLDKLRARKVMLMYGDHDWMDRYAGFLMNEELKHHYERYAGNGKVEYVEVPEAGHNLFLDNPDFFSSKISAFLST